MVLLCRADRPLSYPVLGAQLPRQPLRVAAVDDPQRHFGSVNYRTAKGSFDHLVSFDEDSEWHF